jgi:hypothetical protein
MEAVVNKLEAAKLLGVSVRTLERLCSTGQLKKGRARHKTRPIVVFDKEEILELKKRMTEGLPEEVFGRPNSLAPKNAIGFRLDPYYIKRLEDEGRKHGMSGADYARRLVIRGLEVSDELGSLKRSLSNMFYLILVSKLGATEAEAEELVRTMEVGG